MLGFACCAKTPRKMAVLDNKQTTRKVISAAGTLKGQTAYANILYRSSYFTSLDRQGSFSVDKVLPKRSFSSNSKSKRKIKAVFATGRLFCPTRN